MGICIPSCIRTVPLNSHGTDPKGGDATKAGADGYHPEVKGPQCTTLLLVCAPAVPLLRTCSVMSCYIASVCQRAVGLSDSTPVSVTAAWATVGWQAQYYS